MRWAMNISRAIGPAIAGPCDCILRHGVALPHQCRKLPRRHCGAVDVAGCAGRVTCGAPERYLASLRGGFSQVATNRALRYTLLRSVLFFIFGSCYWALLPLVAHDHLHGDARLFGVLVACIGAGAVATAFVLPVLRSRWGLDRILHAATVATALALAGYALLRIPALGMLTSLLAGSAWLASLSSVIVSAQIAVPDALRGRGMAMFSAVFYGCLALGSCCGARWLPTSALRPPCCWPPAGLLSAWSWHEDSPCEADPRHALRRIMVNLYFRPEYFIYKAYPCPLSQLKKRRNQPAQAGQTHAAAASPRIPDPARGP